MYKIHVQVWTEFSFKSEKNRSISITRLCTADFLQSLVRHAVFQEQSRTRLGSRQSRKKKNERKKKTRLFASAPGFRPLGKIASGASIAACAAASVSCQWDFPSRVSLRWHRWQRKASVVYLADSVLAIRQKQNSFLCYFWWNRSILPHRPNLYTLLECRVIDPQFSRNNFQWASFRAECCSIRRRFILSAVGNRKLGKLAIVYTEAKLVSSRRFKHRLRFFPRERLVNPW